MLKKYSVLIGVICSGILLLIATSLYPGGSWSDKNMVGFDWTKNFISNLFAPIALNGSLNPSRNWANAGMIFLSLSLALFFIDFSKKIPRKGASNVIKYWGAGSAICTFLIATPWHDIMVTIASTMFLLAFFYITVFVLKSRLHLFKFLCIICLLIFYYTLYLYGAGDFAWLPIMQKITFASAIGVILLLQHFTQKEDFQHLISS
ncbi:hypothetical protein P1X15_06000 [Runella sp. MFBS21]|uniref:hypothetical protein n=1 Tax=Runella sp. MFBS21 TaxID=3034018 RepID=UPI0023F87749|nr:hypothetical protein [Runella sp. MFBS21]MDF7817138.1 hypothetical protein [Runella sp. MFBS21]